MSNPKLGLLGMVCLENDWGVGFSQAAHVLAQTLDDIEDFDGDLLVPRPPHRTGERDGIGLSLE